jgi:hypothetical protein
MFPSLFGPSKIDTLLSYTKVKIPPYIEKKIREYMSKDSLPSDPTSLKALIEHPCTTNYLNYVLFENGKALVDCDQNKTSPFCFTELAQSRKKYPNYVEPHAREFPTAAAAAKALATSTSRYRLNDALSGDYGLLAKVIAKEITADLPENKRYRLQILDSIEDDISDIATIFTKGYPTTMREYLEFDGATPIAVKSDTENRIRFEVCDAALPGPRELARPGIKMYGHRFDGRLVSGSKTFNESEVRQEMVDKTCRQANKYDGDKKLSWQLYAEDIRRKGGLPFPTNADVSVWKRLTGMKPCDKPITDEVWNSYLAMITPAASAEPMRVVLPPQRMGTPLIPGRPTTSVDATYKQRYGQGGSARKTRKMTRPKARRPLKQHAGKPATRKHHDRHRKLGRNTRSQKTL